MSVYTNDQILGLLRAATEAAARAASERIGCGLAEAADGAATEAMLESLAALPFAAIELPLSCPHTPGYGTLAGHGTPEATAAITAAVRVVTKKPVFVKVSPNIPGIGELAAAAEGALVARPPW